MSNIEYQTQSRHSNFECWNIEYQTKSNIRIECRISNIKLNPTFKFRMLNIEYQTRIQHSNRMSNIEYQTQSHIQILNVEYRISN